MSSTTIKLIWSNRTIEDVRELSNSHGFAPFIWSSVCEQYLGSSSAWLFNDKALWPLWRDERLPLHWRMVLGSTYDQVVIEAKDFLEMAKAYREFVSDVGRRNRECHLIAIAYLMEKLAARANPDLVGMCFHVTSTTSDPWTTWNEELEESEPFDFENAEKPAWSLFEGLAGKQRTIFHKEQDQ